MKQWRVVLVTHPDVMKDWRLPDDMFRNRAFQVGLRGPRGLALLDTERLLVLQADGHLQIFFREDLLE